MMYSTDDALLWKAFTDILNCCDIHFTYTLFHMANLLNGIIIILHKCTKNYDHMQYCSWDMASDRCNCYFSFWAIFCPFVPNSPKKSKFQKNEKSTWRYHHFTRVYQKFWLDDIKFLRNGVRQMDRWTEKVTQRGGWFT